jgi:hypothetical protein
MRVHRAASRHEFNVRHEYNDDGELLPLDGEEGELIDDEACFIDVRAVTGVGANSPSLKITPRALTLINYAIDILSALPSELALHLLSFLDFRSILTCLAVCKSWRMLAGDNAVWRGLFERMSHKGWAVDLTRARVEMRSRSDLDWLKKERTRDREYGVASLAHVIEEWSRRRLSSQTHAIVRKYSTVESIRSRYSFCIFSHGRYSTFIVFVHSAPVNATRSPLLLNWRHLYRTRYLLDQRWSAAPAPYASVAGTCTPHELCGKAYEPVLTKLSGHADSVYCTSYSLVKFAFWTIVDQSHP